MAKLSKQDLIDLSIANIIKDREKAHELLEDVAEHIGEEKTRYSTTGMVAAKYLETLQRSNEQLVKIISLMKKKDDDAPDLDPKDKESLYDDMEEEANSQPDEEDSMSEAFQDNIEELDE